MNRVAVPAAATRLSAGLVQDSPVPPQGPALPLRFWCRTCMHHFPEPYCTCCGANLVRSVRLCGGGMPSTTAGSNQPHSLPAVPRADTDPPQLFFTPINKQEPAQSSARRAPTLEGDDSCE